VALFGTSYGARLALQVARHHSDRLDRLVLSSPIPAEANFVHDVGPSFDRALREIDGACRQSPSCASLVPDLLGTLESTLHRLDRQPATVTGIDPQSGLEGTRTVDALTLSSVVYSLFYVPGGPQAVPAVVAAAARGDYGFLGIGPPRPEGELPEGPISLGMQASFLCAEEAAQRSPAQADPGQTYAARLIVQHSPIVGPGLAGLCAVWPVDPAPPELFTPIDTGVPTLVVTGRFDQITPPAYGRAIAERLPNAVYVQAEAAGHSPLFGAGLCGLVVLDDFLTDDWANVDPACLTDTPALPPEPIDLPAAAHLLDQPAPPGSAVRTR
jgi:pimeloyl-ACP methyl ester carboxylesterase